MKLTRFNNRNELNQYFIKKLSLKLNEAIIRKGIAYLVVSGGRSPIKLFEQLSVVNLPWEKIIVTLSDERLISPAEQDSNEYMVKNSLLINCAKKAKFISLLRDDFNDIKKIIKNSELIFSKLPMFDVVILGMGEDGHTASLFPCSAEAKLGLSDKNKNSIIHIIPATAPYERISMTKNRLCKSHNVYLYLLGGKKYEIFKKSLPKRESDPNPISAFLWDKSINMEVLHAME